LGTVGYWGVPTCEPLGVWVFGLFHSVVELVAGGAHQQTPVDPVTTVQLVLKQEVLQVKVMSCHLCGTKGGCQDKGNKGDKRGVANLNQLDFYKRDPYKLV